MKSGYIFIANNVLPSLFAISQLEQEKGLMDTDYPIPNMSFLYSSPKINKFWMHRTKIPLDIIFTCHGEINQICKGEPYSTRIIGEDKNSDLVIELPFGTAQYNNFKIGMKAGLVTPKLAEIKKLFNF